ncbi:sulfatase [Chitinophaga sp. XS-30]|uniref:sulfatase n=1 Tax=Chitinophaga sp. XS-30 TaxID=2604421 RepID=UPI0011DCA51C|nr:sulfatase [Chitinophaga sp. XS-30]QEH43379.1 sulfatase [Chitinophaga sp. XS-30]
MKPLFAIKPLLLLVLAAGLFTQAAAQPQGKKYNVLFIAADDLNNDLGCYGNRYVQSPQIDRLARSGVAFHAAYNQYPLCSPSRSSMLTGMRPDKVGIYDLETHFRKHFPDVITLPQLFRNADYFSARVGKIFHYGVPGQIGTNGLDDPASWDTVVNPKGRDKTEEHLVKNLTPARGLGAALAWHRSEGTDEEQTDGLVTTEAIRLLAQQKKGEPFFLAVGYFRPHAPYVAPGKYFDLYPKETVPLAKEMPGDMDDIPEAALFTRPAHWGLNESDRRDAQRAYYAAVSFMDGQVGRLLDALEQLGLAENTIIVLWSDHGYNLGQHGQWKKQSLFEPSARVPLIIAVPGGAKGTPCRRTVELLDVYPTLAELCDLPVPEHVQGRSLTKLLKDPAAAWKHPAYTEVVRNGIFGRSVRTERWRYTEWDNGNEGTELYDHRNDPGEFVNLAREKKCAAEVKRLQGLLRKPDVFSDRWLKGQSRR